MTPLILLVDDERDYLEMVAMSLESHGLRCVLAHDGIEARERLRAGDVDLVVSDVNMPRLDGFSLCRELRGQDATLPIILLTSRDSEIDETLGLELGADDYIAKPVSNRVLLARIRALLRRAHAVERASLSEVLTHGPLTLDEARLSVTCQGRALEGITVTEFRLLFKLAGSPGRVFTRAQLLRAMREDGDSFVAERMVDSYINRLRRKLAPHDGLLETVVGMGYRMAAAPS